MASRFVALTLALLIAFPGCSVYKASTQPPPAELNGLGIGSLRGEVIMRLGAPKFSDTDPQGRKQDTYEFDSGLHSGSKARVILYLAADFFTLCLAELVLWPMEMTVMERAKCSAYVTYDQSQKVEIWKVSQKEGVQDC
ncbi:MAG: hypothetical protein ACREIH_03310 [Nitrospiraceae bacterium]